MAATVFFRVLMSNVAVPYPGSAAKCFVKTHDGSILAELKGMRNFLRSLLLFDVNSKLDFLSLKATSLSHSLSLNMNCP